MAKAESTSRSADLDAELSGLDALELASMPQGRRLRRWWDLVWPGAAALGLGLGLWQAVAWTHWRPDYVLPGPATVMHSLLRDLVGAPGQSVSLWAAIGTTMGRAVAGFLLALLIGTLIGVVVSNSRNLRRATGSLITGLQTMPSIAWFPLAILLFKAGESAILFVVILGAAPAIANGLISGVDHIPPAFIRAGRVMGAKGVSAFRHITFPAALPHYIAGLKQGWAFAWRSLMAAELVAGARATSSIGGRLQSAGELADAQLLFSTMIVILAIGIAVDAVVFNRLGRVVRNRRGLNTGAV